MKAVEAKLQISDKGKRKLKRNMKKLSENTCKNIKNRKKGDNN